MNKHSLAIDQSGIGLSVSGEDDATCQIECKNTGDTLVSVSNSYEVDATTSITLIVNDAVSITITQDSVSIGKDDNSVVLDSDAIQLTAGSSSITLKDGEIDFEADDINFKGNKSISIKSSDSVSVQGSSVAAKGTDSVSIESSATLDLNASTTATLKGSSQTSVG
ncbi:type VI secretion system tip protein TssI/VgrG [uncultured Shewanella sp.]|uniref:type VI secretion system tip protein TssI/VgrG n=1 Tax=uncultured Shewanella sp. TaxID=173975 RepID=UPI0026078E27|nr:type VI secretion system tip protein TssI/VgrG [uncultured Shewanella sp.]